MRSILDQRNLLNSITACEYQATIMANNLLRSLLRVLALLQSCEQWARLSKLFGKRSSRSRDCTCELRNVSMKLTIICRVFKCTQTRNQPVPNEQHTWNRNETVDHNMADLTSKCSDPMTREVLVQISESELSSCFLLLHGAAATAAS